MLCYIHLIFFYSPILWIASIIFVLGFVELTAYYYIGFMPIAFLYMRLLLGAWFTRLAIFHVRLFGGNAALC